MGAGKVFVCYESVDEACEARRRLAGRLFDNRVIMTSFYPEELFKQEQYGGFNRAAIEYKTNEADDVAQSAAEDKEIILPQ